MPPPFFSVVIPTYNRAPLLQATLDSVFSQSWMDYEVIVVDDGSDDDTAQVVADYGGRIEYLQQKNRGPGAARNLAISAAKGRYAAFLDSDDLWFPWSLEIYAEVIKGNGEPEFVAGKPRRFSDTAEISGFQRGPYGIRLFADYLASGSQWRWWGVSSFVIRLDALRKTGGFTNDLVNGEDADLALKLGIAPGFLQVISPETFAYREHAGSVMLDLDKTIGGTWLMISSENAGSYPGGTQRALERWRVVTRHIRPVSLECIKLRRYTEAWDFYRASFRWNLQLLRIRYLLAFPLILLFKRFQLLIFGKVK